jgi:hypothetical protein
MYCWQRVRARRRPARALYSFRCWLPTSDSARYNTSLQDSLHPRLSYDCIWDGFQTFEYQNLSLQVSSYTSGF